MSVEDLTQQLAGININRNTTAAMDEIVKQIAEIHANMAGLAARIPVVTAVEEYKETRVVISDIKEISLDMFKSLPTFSGDREQYPSWRETAVNVMRVFRGFTTTPKYFEALNIVRAKITGAASKTLTNYNTVLNIDAILARLDFAYSDKRPIYIVEQEMIVLRQRKLSIEEFYDAVNIKLNALINKIKMSHTSKDAIEAMTTDASAKALRTFITGLNGGLGTSLYASNPQDLPDAYARLQTIMYDQQAMSYNNRFAQTQRNHGMGQHQLNPGFTYTQRTQGNNDRHDANRINNNQPDMNRFPRNNQPGPSRSAANSRNTFRPRQEFSNNWRNEMPKPEPMDIDKTSINVNVGRDNRGGNFSRQTRQHKINQIEEVSNEYTDEEDDEEEYLEENEEISETTSIFLGN